MRALGPVAGRRQITRLWRPELPWSDSLLWSLLVPAATMYWAATAARAAWWRVVPARRRASRLKVLSVGNLTVGGSGKTPFALYLANLLVEHGIESAIVCRGYRGRYAQRAQLVAEGGELRTGPDEAGDEAVMMAKSFAGPIMVARRRYDAIRVLEKRAGLKAVVLDDAFQHLRLERDLNLVLFNAEYGLGNGWILPAGPMRERLRALRRADAVVVTQTAAGPIELPASLRANLGGRPVLRAVLRPRAVVRPQSGRWQELPLEVVAGRRVVAISGVARPQPFYAMLHALEATVVDSLEYPDHHCYTWADWQAICRSAQAAEFIVTTEKDLVKLERFPFPRDSLCALRMGVDMGSSQPVLLDLVLGCLLKNSDAKGSEAAPEVRTTAG
jgi:tetraacyldisaccharide 4'-kinase